MLLTELLPISLIHHQFDDMPIHRQQRLPCKIVKNKRFSIYRIKTLLPFERKTTRKIYNGKSVKDQDMHKNISLWWTKKYHRNLL